MNTWVILAIVVGAVVLATVMIVGMSSGPSLPGELLPQELAGFQLVGQFDYIEPIFEGERYSSLVSFAPAEGAEFAGKVERMGITAYRFKSQGEARAATEVLLDSMGLGTEEIELDGQLAFAYDGLGQAGLIWRIGPIIYQVFVTAPEGSEPDPEALEKAARAAAKAVLKLWGK
ncbi:MAG: hypothetical protein ACUVRH_01140 [Candidatus Bipolaricaulia bacterium]